MKFGVREIANIAFKAKTDMQIGKYKFKEGEPVFYFDTAKTSTLEGASTAVYAQGGRGNPRLVTWQGEKTLTFTFEDALISKISMQMLMGAEILTAENGATGTVNQHVYGIITAMPGDEGSENKPYLNTRALISEFKISPDDNATIDKDGLQIYKIDENGDLIYADVDGSNADQLITQESIEITGDVITAENIKANERYMIDGYRTVPSSEIVISPDYFAGAFYIEGDTLFRRESDGYDVPCQFILPKGQIQSNFTLSMANSGDPSTFTFTVDAMPDYVRRPNGTYKDNKVLCELNLLGA